MPLVSDVVVHIEVPALGAHSYVCHILNGKDIGHAIAFAGHL